jgi:tol-pal system protein YbgF
MGRMTSGVGLVVAAVGVFGLVGLAEAQQPAQRPATSKAASKAQPKAGDSTEGQLKSRVDQLEEQLADMQVMIGTLESLGRGGAASPVQGGRPAAGAGGGVDQARIDSLETQIRALTAQLEQLSGQVRQLSGNRRGDAGPALPNPAAPPAAVASAPQPPALPGVGESAPPLPGEAADPIGRVLGQPTPQTASAPPGLPPSAAAASNPRELYETAYGYLLQQDYGAAEVAFEEFMRRYPSDRLAPDAQYWLGETLYVQRRYKPAGQAFLVVVEKYKASAKVPSSLLKLAQSLEQLGQKDCGIFAELDSRHPNAPADVKARARVLKQRQGC